MFVVSVRRLFAPDDLCEHPASLVLKLEAAAESGAEADENAFGHIQQEELASRLDRPRLFSSF